MKYEQLLSDIYKLAEGFADMTGKFPTVLHVHPSTYWVLTTESTLKGDGRFYQSYDNVNMFMDFRIEQDRSVPKDTILLNDSLMYGVLIEHDVQRNLHVVWIVRPDGTHVDKPYYALTLDKAVERAGDIVRSLGKDYHEYHGVQTY